MTLKCESVFDNANRTIHNFKIKSSAGESDGRIANSISTGIFILLERVILDDTVEGVPVLMLANKQDVPTALRLESIKEIFNQIAERLGARDSRVLPISALEG